MSQKYPQGKLTCPRKRNHFKKKGSSYNHQFWSCLRGELLFFQGSSPVVQPLYPKYNQVSHYPIWTMSLPYILQLLNFHDECMINCLENNFDKLYISNVFNKFKVWSSWIGTSPKYVIITYLIYLFVSSKLAQFNVTTWVFVVLTLGPLLQSKNSPTYPWNIPQNPNQGIHLGVWACLGHAPASNPTSNPTPNCQDTARGGRSSFRSTSPVRRSAWNLSNTPSEFQQHTRHPKKNCQKSKERGHRIYMHIVYIIIRYKH